MRFHGLMFGMVVTLVGLCIHSQVAVAQTPAMNVLFITADDLGLQLSCYGETLIRTPHLDTLAASGTRFKVAYVAQASCSPSRSAMFTGLHTHSTGQFGLVNAGLSLHPPLRERTIPNLLKQAGYRTGIIGKLHVAPEASFRFDYRPRVNTRRVRDVAAKATDFLEGNPKAPFFLMVNYSDPHAYRDSRESRQWYFQDQVDGIPADPIKANEKTIFPWQGIDTPEMRVRTAGYYNTVKRLDVGVGLLMDVLRDAGHERDTLVIFVGDHGPPFCRGKTTCYEAGLRVPFIVRWPGVSKPFVSDAMVSTIDILPTILDATGLPQPGKMHGRSLRPVVSDPEASWREYLVAEFHFHGRRPFYPRRAIRDGHFKLIHNLRAGAAKPGAGIDGDPAYRLSQGNHYTGTEIQAAFQTFADPPEYELYDLSRDPVEFKNLAGRPAYQTTLERLKHALSTYRQATEDPFLEEPAMQKMIDHAR